MKYIIFDNIFFNPKLLVLCLRVHGFGGNLRIFPGYYRNHSNKYTLRL